MATARLLQARDVGRSLVNSVIDLRDVERQRGVVYPRLQRPSPAAAVLDDISAASWVQAFDAAWLGGDRRGLERLLAPDVEFLPQGGADVIVGRAAVLGHLRRALAGGVVHEYRATDVRGRASRSVSIVTYRWQLECARGGERSVAKGRDVPALRAVGEGCQLGWRIQLRA